MAKLVQSMNLSQSLRMTPQLQQAIKLLQLNRLELETAIRKELDENPLLEETVELREEDIQRTREAALEVETSPGPGEGQNPHSQDEFDWDHFMDVPQRPGTLYSIGNDEIMNYENVISTSVNLYDHLLWQARMFGFNEEEEKLVEIIINYINEDGYITTPMEEIAKDEGVQVQELLDVLPFVQEMDPPGIGARDLKECLLIQAKLLEEDTHDLVKVIQFHIKDLEKKNYEGIAKSISRSKEEVVELSKIILSMEPKPGRAYATQEVQYVTPDVYVYKVGDDYMVSLNEDGLPRLKISNFYKNLLKEGKDFLHDGLIKENLTSSSAAVASSSSSSSGGEQVKDTQDYIQKKLRSAVWLIKSIHQRQKTIFKVAESIVRHQKPFLDKGAAYIRPMVLRDIASDIGMHESTVSRVTNSKYIHTPQGIFELKYFFNSGITRSDGESLASESVKLRIKDMILKEDPYRPLSDQDLVVNLQREGLKIARRTIAKYREMLKILPSSRRKKIKQS